MPSVSSPGIEDVATRRNRALCRLGSVLGALVFVIGCPGFGDQEPVSALDDVAPDAPLCEQVQAIMQTHCDSCHSATPREGAPGYLRTDTFLDTDRVGGAQLWAERIWVRSNDGTMPPDAPLGQDELAVLRAWLDDGASIDACLPNAASALVHPSFDAGVADASSAPDAP